MNHHSDKPASRPDNRDAWKMLQIMAEFIDGMDRLKAVGSYVSIFGSARLDQQHPHCQSAKQIARGLSDEGFAVVSGGGGGIMEAVNRGAQEGRSTSIALNIRLPKFEEPNPYQDVSVQCRHFFARKFLFVKYACAFVVMPGGFGTLDELSEVLTLMQTRKTRQLPIILVGKDYWQGLVTWFEEVLLAQGLINQQDMDLFQLIDEPDQVVATIRDFYQHRGLLHLEDDDSSELEL